MWVNRSRPCASRPVAAARVRVSKPDAPIAVPFDDVAVTILRFPGAGE